MRQVSIKKNFAYKSTLTVSSYLMAFMTFPYVSRVLGVEALGLVSFVDNTVNYFILFATMGIALLGVREIAVVKENSRKLSSVFSNIIGLNTLFTLVVLFVYLVLIATIPKLNQFSELFYIGVAKIIFTVLLVEWFYTGIEHFRYITIRSIFIKLAYVFAVFVFIKDPNDYILYFILTVGVVVLNAIINIIYIRKFVVFILRDVFSLKYFKQNISLGIYSIMTSMYLTFNVMYLGLVTDNVQVGYYTTAFKLYSVVLGLFTAFTNVMLPRMSALLADGEAERFQVLVKRSFSVMSIFSIPVIVCGIILAPQFIYVISGNGYEGAILPMRIIMPAMLFVGIAQVSAIQILMPMKKDRILLYASLLGAFISIILNLILVSSWESIGSAIVLFSAEMVVTIFYIGYLKKNEIANLPFKSLLIGVYWAFPSLLISVLIGTFVKNPFICIGVVVPLMLFYLFFIYRKVLKKHAN